MSILWAPRPSWCWVKRSGWCWRGFRSGLGADQSRPSTPNWETTGSLLLMNWLDFFLLGDVTSLPDIFLWTLINWRCQTKKGVLLRFPLIGTKGPNPDHDKPPQIFTAPQSTWHFVVRSGRWSSPDIHQTQIHPSDFRFVPLTSFHYSRFQGQRALHHSRQRLTDERFLSRLQVWELVAYMFMAELLHSQLRAEGRNWMIWSWQQLLEGHWALQYSWLLAISVTDEPVVPGN